MAVGDSHESGPDGHPLCGANGPLRGYNATSPACRDCSDLDRGSQWKTTAPYAPHPNTHVTAHALLRKRPARLLP